MVPPGVEPGSLPRQGSVLAVGQRDQYNFLFLEIFKYGGSVVGGWMSGLR